MQKQKIWGERRYIDFWSINHILFGIISAHILTSVLKLDIVVALTSAVAIYIIWELIEIFLKVGEKPTNSIVDILVSILGFNAYLLLPFLKDYIYIILIIYIFLEIFGYLPKLKKIKKLL